MKERDIRGLDVAALRAFDALMRERSVSRAAGRLFLSQSAVSAQLNRLRRVFGDTLFARTPHGVTPTPMALALAPRIEKLLADLNALVQSGQDFEPARSERVFRVAGSDFASSWLLPTLGSELARMGSGIRILWEPPGTWPLPERLHKSELDLAVVARLRPPRDMLCEVLYEDGYVFARRRGHPLAGHAPSVEEFCATPQIILGYGSSVLDDTIDDLLARDGRGRLTQIAVSSFGQILHQLLHSDHGAVLGRRVALGHAQSLDIQPLPFEVPRYQSLLCWSRRGDADAGIQWLKQCALRIAREGIGRD